MNAAELLDVAEVERLALRPGDMLVLKVPLWLSEAEFAEIDRRFCAVLPGVKVLVLECGMDISVLRADEQPEQQDERLPSRLVNADDVAWAPGRSVVG